MGARLYPRLPRFYPKLGGLGDEAEVAWEPRAAPLRGLAGGPLGSASVEDGPRTAAREAIQGGRL
jgi:hypothetical protein